MHPKLVIKLASVSQPKYEVKVVKNVLIPMQDGVNLAADLYRPSVEGEYPAIVFYGPYRKDDFAGVFFKDICVYFAKRGYVAVPVDVRGTGGSGGSTSEMLSTQEQREGRDIIEWIAKQPWCDGNVGMTGESYLALTSYLVATQNPPHLKAIIPVYGGDDEYETSYPGGNPNLYTSCIYNAQMIAVNSMPPYIDSEGRWLKVWKHHLNNNVPWFLSSLKNQTDSSFWHKKSLRYFIEKVKIPVFIIGGWHDIFPSQTFRIYSSIDAPKKVLMGPWKHISPDVAVPGPRIDYLHEMLRWFDYWLKGKDTGIVDEPPVTIYVQKYEVPASRIDTWKGEWRNETEWPIKRSKKKALYLWAEGILSEQSPSKEEGADTYNYNPTVGTQAGSEKSGHSTDFGLPLDQRPDEILSLIYTTKPLKSDTEVTGSAHSILYISSSADTATLVVKLCDVAPDGTSALVTRGSLNLTHLESHEKPTAIEPNKMYKVPIDLDVTSYVFQAGHRLRLYVSSADLPYIWPTPKACTITVHHNSVYPSQIVLPIIPPQEYPLPKPEFQASLKVPAGARGTWTISRDPILSTLSEKVKYTWAATVGEEYRFSMTNVMHLRASAKEPSDVLVKTSSSVVLSNLLFSTDIKSHCVMRTTTEAFHTFMCLNIMIDGLPYFSKSWSKSVPRSHL